MNGQKGTLTLKSGAKVGTVPPSSHGLYVKSPNGLRLRYRRVRRLVRKMFNNMPWLQESDEPSARAWAELEILGSRMFAELETAGFLSTTTNEPRRLVTEYRQLRQAQITHARELGMTPSSRAALGLTIAEGYRSDVATQLAQLRVERERSGDDPDAGAA